MYQKYGRDYAVLQTMEEYDRLSNKTFLSDDEKVMRDSLPLEIAQYKKKIGMELTQDEIDYLNSNESAEPIED